MTAIKRRIAEILYVDGDYKTMLKTIGLVRNGDYLRVNDEGYLERTTDAAHAFGQFRVHEGRPIVSPLGKQRK